MTTSDDAPALWTPSPARGRVALSIALLVGFYVLGAVVVAACLFANWAVWAAGRIHFGLVIGSIVAIFGVLRGVFTAGAKFTGLPGSVEITADDQPELFSEIHGVANAMDMAAPDRVFMVHDMNAFVLEDTRLLGLVTKQRIMGLGLPLLDALSVSELRGVIAHEFGHYAGNDTRLAPLVYRGRESITNTLRTVGGGVVGYVYVAYFKLYLSASMSVSRQQELAADAWSVRIAGTDSTIRTQERLGALGAAFGSFLDRYVSGLLGESHRPVNMFDGFRQMLFDPGNGEAMEHATAAALAEDADRYDTHPSTRERIDFIRSLPRMPVRGDSRSAGSLLAHREHLETTLTEVFLTAAWHGGDLIPVAWDDAGSVFAQAVLPIAHKFNVVANAPTSRDAVMSYVNSSNEERIELASAALGMMPTSDDPLGPLRTNLGASIGKMLVDAGTHRWVVSWSGPVMVAPVGGGPVVEIWELAADATSGDAPAVDTVAQLVAGVNVS